MTHIRSSVVPDRSYFAPLTVVACTECGHMYNHDFSERLLDRMYGDTPLTNVPVHQTMLDRLNKLAEWIGDDHLRNKRVLEIGGGTGHFAYAMAKRARHVTICEPCFQLTPGTFDVTNITVFNVTFPNEAAGNVFDFISCRQVIEHVVAPLDMLKAIRAALAPGGRAYLELPRAEYIQDHASPIDFHIQHVQYFSEPNFLRLAAEAGLVPERTLVIMNGHDFGFLFRAAASTPAAVRGDEAAIVALRRRVVQRIESGRKFLAGIAGKTALYGANTYGQAVLGLYGDVLAVDVVLDDSEWYEGYSLYNRDALVPVSRPRPEVVQAMDTIVITAYLHDTVIAEKLRAQGYKGHILSVRPSQMTANSAGMEAVLRD